MSLTIHYDSNFANFEHNGDEGLAAFMAYFQDSYSSSGHASDMGFHNSPGDLDIGSTTYNDEFFFTQVIGEQMSNTSTTVDNVSFVVDAGEVTLEDGNGDAYSEAAVMYTGFTSPSHVMAGEIESLTFGDGGYSAGSLASDLFTITGLDTAISSGFLDTDSDGAYDALEIGGGETHDLIYDLMGGMGGSGGTSVLEAILNANDIVHEGTSADETFDVFDGQDTLNLGGGDDVVNIGFEIGSGGDVIDLSDMGHSFTDSADAASDVTYSGGNAYLTYNDGFDLNTVELIGVSSGLTADNFIV